MHWDCYAATKKQLYTQFSHALPDVNGTSDWQLPIPATFVIAPNRQILLAHIDVDYRNRLEPSEALAIASQAKTTALKN